MANANCAWPVIRLYVDRRVGDFLRREAKADLEQASRVFAEQLGVTGQACVDPRSVEPLGLMLDDGCIVLFVAAHSRAALCARLSRRA